MAVLRVAFGLAGWNDHFSCLGARIAKGNPEPFAKPEMFPLHGAFLSSLGLPRVAPSCDVVFGSMGMDIMHERVIPR
jgi:hypothetical protein